VGRLLVTLALALVIGTSSALGAGPTAREIVEQATAAAGGDAWRYARTIRLSGHATLHRGGNVAGVEATRYEMRRVYPRSLDDANSASGKFRLDAHREDELLFTMSFDGTQMYDRNGPLPPDESTRQAAAAFGFSAIRFALSDDFRLQRLPDDQVEGHACYFVKVVDPSGSDVLFAIDQADASIRLVAWDSPRGWHHRVYSDFYWVDDPGFRQPGRVRLYYDGIKTADIRWTQARVNTPISDDVFVIEPAAADQSTH
jgi:hypothetical protein